MDIRGLFLQIARGYAIVLGIGILLSLPMSVNVEPIKFDAAELVFDNLLILGIIFFIILFSSPIVAFIQLKKSVFCPKKVSSVEVVFFCLIGGIVFIVFSFLFFGLMWYFLRQICSHPICDTSLHILIGCSRCGLYFLLVWGLLSFLSRNMITLIISVIISIIISIVVGVMTIFIEPDHLFNLENFPIPVATKILFMEKIISLYGWFVLGAMIMIFYYYSLPKNSSTSHK